MGYGMTIDTGLTPSASEGQRAARRVAERWTSPCAARGQRGYCFAFVDDTELADSTMTRPSAVSAAVAPIRMRTIRECLAATSASVRSSRRTSRRCLGTSIALVAIIGTVCVLVIGHRHPRTAA